MHRQEGSYLKGSCVLCDMLRMLKVVEEKWKARDLADNRKAEHGTAKLVCFNLYQLLLFVCCFINELIANLRS